MAKGKELKAIESERAKQRQGTRTDIVEIFPPSDKGKTRDKVAEQIGLGSGRTYEKARITTLCV